MKLKDLENKHEGKLGFVIGAGPSLHFQDIEPLKDYVTITVNSGILKIPNCDYFVSDDEGVKAWNYYRMIAKDSDCIKLLFKDKLGKAVEGFKKDQLLFFKHKTWYDPGKNRYYPEGLLLTKDAEDPIIGARTSLATAIHWAYIMGCDPIVLLGCDCCYHGRKRYFWQFPGEMRAYRLDGRPTMSAPNKGQKDGKGLDNHCIDFLNYWQQFATANKKIINIIDASEGGILDCFPKMSLIDVLKKYKNKL